MYRPSRSVDYHPYCPHSWVQNNTVRSSRKMQDSHKKEKKIQLKPDSKLRKALHINWVFSLLSGSMLLIFEGFIKEVFTLEYAFGATGAQLIFFSALVAFAAFHKRILKVYTRVIIVLDLFWVIFCMGILLSPAGISAESNFLVGASGLIVGSLAYFQFKGLKSYSKLTS